MRRRWPWAVLLLVALGGAGGYLYSEKQETGEIARAVWQELPGKGDPEEAQAEPLFQDLKPEKLGAAEATQQPPAPARQPEPAEAPTAAPPVPQPSEKTTAEPKQTATKAPATPTPPPVRTANAAVPASTPTPRSTEAPPAAPEPKPATKEEVKAAQPTPASPPVSAAPKPTPAPAQETATDTRPAPSPAAPAPPPAARTTGQDDGGSMRPNPFSNNVHVLLIANDQEKIGEGRADSIMLVTLNPDRKVATLLSIPRDTRVAIPGHGMDKVNHAYRFGGAALLNRTLQRFLGFPFQYYAEISYGGFRNMIDQVGGVDVEVPFSFDYEGYHFEKGPMHLDGKTALAYSRMRKLDPRGAFGREDRHQQIVRALMERLADIPVGDTVRMNAFARELIPYVRTDLGPRKIVTLRRAHPYADKPPVKLNVRGHGQMMNGIYYYIVNDAERRRLHLALR
ncbi:LCP family protein [Deinococcus planocerae]|uniref:LCP family protein n=1 Tax=Deinococcus planocerae TaxID=1737569 RepID=UPI0011AF03D8|nr:LCP family protein [Deinococcus planocerae]